LITNYPIYGESTQLVLTQLNQRTLSRTLFKLPNWTVLILT